MAAPEITAPRKDDPGATDQNTDSHRPTTDIRKGSGGGQCGEGELAELLRAEAVEYARRHWAVFPLAVGNKIPRIPSPHPPRTRERAVCKGECGQLGHGVNDATDAAEAVFDLWTRYPASNIGARIPDGALLIDIDPRHGGDVTWRALLDKHGSWPDCLIQFSGRGDGGAHLFVRRPPGKLSPHRLGPGIDLKTMGGYAVMAPSIHPDSGKPYVRFDGPIPAPPEWFVDLVTVKPKPPRPVSLRHRCGSSLVDMFTAATTWEQILSSHGWDCLDPDGDEDGARWRHPDATAPHSATICYGQLFVYSTNTLFEATEPGNPHGYTKFRAFGVLNHDGDLRAAARAIRKGAAL
jgi:hypothetical protein